MSKRLLLLNVLLVSGAAVFSVQLVRTFLAVPPPPPTRGAPKKPLYTPSRPEAGTASVAPTSKPFLYGIVLKDGAPAAFLEDPVTKKVTSYKVGDSLAGGQRERIQAGRGGGPPGAGTVRGRLREP